jgi:hypothetical protein
MRALPFWIAAAGALLLAAASIKSSPLIEVIGAALLTLGVLGFFVAAVRRSRTEGIGLATAFGRSARDAVRFAWYLMP